MELILKIAWRNILRHKGKSIIIGVILFLGALIMTIGNGVISGMERGLQDNIINGFTGDIVIISDKQESDNVLFTLMGKAIEPINNFPKIKGTLIKQNYVEKFLPAGRNMALILNEEGGAPGFAFLIGVDYSKYQEMFPGNMKPVEGRLMEKGERGVIVPTGSRKMFYDYTGLWFMPVNEKFNLENFKKELGEKEDTTGLVIKDNIVFLGYNDKNTSLDVRLDIKGIVKFKGLDNIFGHFNIVDIESYRECLGYFSAEDLTVEISEEKKNILESDNLDDLFGEESVIVSKVENTTEKKVYPHTKPTDSKSLSNTESFEKPLNIDSSTNSRFGVGVNIETGTYNVVFVKLKKDISIKEGLEKINKELKAANLGVRAVSWKKAFGLIGSMATVIKGALFGFVMLLFVVAIIIIVNTLSMAALERTSEIGMMRAVGARKGFISSMFIAETGILSFIFGGAGIVFGIVAVKIIPILNITSSNDMVQILYGGNRFTPFLNLTDIMLTVIQLTMVTLIAVIYPVKVAKSITPLDAIVRD